MGKLTGPDYLAAVAERAGKDGLPFADAFKDMVWDCFSDPLPGGVGTRGAEIAKRPLTPDEQAPVAIVLAALQATQRRHDKKSRDEVLKVGLSLAIKFREYLDRAKEGQ